MKIRPKKARIYRLLGQPVDRIVTEIVATRQYSRDQIDAMVADRLRDVLVRAIRSSPYYRDALGNRYLDDSGAGDLRSIPVLERADLVKHADTIATTTDHVSIWSTSGTSGVSVRLPKTKRDRAAFYAYLHDHQARFGIRMDDREVRLWRSATDLGGTWYRGAREQLDDWLKNVHRTSPVVATVEKKRRVLERLRENRPQFLRGYAFAVYDLARYVEEQSAQGARIPLHVRAVITTGEYLFPHQRRVIESAFDCPLTQEYGATECGLIASECEQGTMHVQEGNVIVEVIDQAGNPCSGEEGDILITALNNEAMPIIRYRIGDRGTLISEQCPCGSHYRALRLSETRPFQYFTRPDGTTVNLLCIFAFGILASKPEIAKSIEDFQFEWSAPTRLRLRLVVSESWFESAATVIQRELSPYMGKAILEIERADAIPPRPSGKKNCWMNTMEADQPST